MYWLPMLVFMAHMAEGCPRFHAWATRHFGATSNAWYVYSHMGLVAIALANFQWAQHGPPRTSGPLFGAPLMWTLAFNAIFHVVTTLLFREYSPGVVTGLFLLLPASGYMYLESVQRELLTKTQIAMAIGIAAVVQIAVVASLYLRMDIDWRMRRLNRPEAL